MICKNIRCTSRNSHQRSVTLSSALLMALLLMTACDRHQPPGEPTAIAAPVQSVQQKQQSQSTAIETQRPTSSSTEDKVKHILFGDLHVHSTFSPDAFVTAMPVMGGSGSRPPAVACDFARYCSALDFWSINDHAEGLTPLRWQETKEAVRQCNAISPDATDPDLVTFLGWEWSQVSHYSAANHYGHKNVIFLDTEDSQVPARPIGAPRDQLGKSPIGRLASSLLSLRDFKNRDYYLGIQQYYDEIAETPKCEQGIASPSLPDNCMEDAADPKTLFKKLNEWGFEHMVIPHGNAWGLNTPPGTTFDKQLNAEQHSPEQQFLFELYSGHGNSEEYRDWRAVAYDSEDRPFCPEPRDNFEPCCWRAGLIIRQRCEAAGIEAAECIQREHEARQNYIDAGVSGHLTVPGQRTEDWLNCGQCEDCFNPGMDHRPATTGQYSLAISDLTQQPPLRFRFGFIGSSDNHNSSAGTGYKEFDRINTTEANGAQDERMARSLPIDRREPLPLSIPLSQMEDPGLNRKRNMERQGSFWLTGGLVAVHSESRARESIWRGLKTKEVYATSGDRILLWFDLVEDDIRYPMGSEVSSNKTPVFKVTAIGDQHQLPGCPDYTEQAIDSQYLQSLCGGECYNPGNSRKIIERIEIVKITPQISEGEDVSALIQDPWQSFECPPSEAGCEISFEDSEFINGNREAIYYARAIQEPSPAINAGGLRCEQDSNGQCISVDPCYSDFRTDRSDDCLAPNAERAWSSPIFVSPAQ